MVERPIKKSERQPSSGNDSKSENSDSMPTPQSNPKSSKQSDDRSKGRGKKASFKDESRQSVNPALARGPKPVKPQPKVIIEPESESQPISEESQD
ncbi:hypothetical protein PI95_007055 [Hassallia byssoidea VB512170]|jgi:hypothetical protein|uniref:Uncharacterized protein n=1 Tax=Hassallia byssoidea VB512170 TaxID=1304833 RepID=A0A846H400_9CYAN|nr:hypothetical protein [Hassalia byssoidea]MBW4569441.1 hypothetical protein [Tolypothrix carrinoi HA7290-LM1]NEU72337.1 hypothetical protein [Hassalia byssoidea VB512170]